jgi:hypothetical protein
LTGRPRVHYNFFNDFRSFKPSSLCAGVVELVDARDSKSRVPCGRVGSIPTAGTIFYFSKLEYIFALNFFSVFLILFPL